MRLTLSRSFVLLLFIGLFVLVTGNITDPDFWWHLQTGRYILQHQTIPHYDPSFTFTAAGRPWLTHEWLSDVLLWALYSVGGPAILSLFFGCVIFASFALIYARSPGKPYAGGLAVLLGALAAWPIMGIRPQMFTLLFMSLEVFLLERFFSRPNWVLLGCLPILMLLWVNLHGGFLLGFVLMLAYLVGKSLELLWPRLRGEETSAFYGPRHLLWLSISLLLSLAIVGINPNGYQIYLFPVGTLSSPAIQNLIGEWFSPDFHELTWLPLAVLLLGILGLGLFTPTRQRLTTIGLVVLLAYAALRTLRNVPLFSVMAAPVLAAQLDAAGGIKPAGVTPSRRMQALLGGLIFIFCTAGVIRIQSVILDQSKIEREALPGGAADWLKDHRPGGRIFNTYHWGGYLSWRLYPNFQVFIDGRAELFGDELLHQYLDIYNTHTGWQQLLQSYKVELVLVEPSSLIAQRLAEDPDWEQVYSDRLSVLFERR